METNQGQNTELIQSVNVFLHNKQQEIEASEGKKGIVVIAIENMGEFHNTSVSIIGQGGVIIEGLVKFLEGQSNGSKLLAHAAKRAMLNKFLKRMGEGCDSEDCKENSSQPADGGDTTTEPEGQTA